MSENFDQIFDGVNVADLSDEERAILKAYLQARKNRARREEEFGDDLLDSLSPSCAPRGREDANKSSVCRDSLLQAAAAEQEALTAWKRLRLEIGAERVAAKLEDGVDAVVTSVEDGVDALTMSVEDALEGLRDRVAGSSIGAVLGGLRRRRDRASRVDVPTTSATNRS